MYIERRDKENGFYHRLQQDSITLLQALSGELWTDFNAHDPGVTILDLLNYGLFELHYRFDFPLTDYLTDPHTGGISFEKLGLFPGERIFSGSVVTAADYEKLVVDRISAVSGCHVGFRDGLYRFTIHLSGEGVDREMIRDQVGKLYHAHRNLCENLDTVAFGETVQPAAVVSDDCPSTDTTIKRAEPVYRDHSGYRSVQWDFPDCYGINPGGIPPGTSTESRARILQLKAYLLIFDHLLAGCGGELSVLREVLEIYRDVPQTGWPEIPVEGISLLTDESKKPAGPVGAESFRLRQRTAWLDTLDMLYGEETEEYFPADDAGRKGNKRAGLIREYPELNATRFRSFDLTYPRSIPSLRRWAAAITDSNQQEEIPLMNLFSRYRLRLVPDTLFFRDYKTMLNIEFAFRDSEKNWGDSRTETIPVRNEEYTERDFQALKRQLALLWHNIIPEGLILYGRDPASYRVVEPDDGKGCLLVWCHPEREKWLNMGYFTSREELTRTANVLWAYLGELHSRCDTFYLLEHPLLYPRETVPAGERNRLSLWLPAWLEPPSGRERYENRLRDRLPAHLMASFHWLHADQWFDVEKLYFDWRQAMAGREIEKTKKTAGNIRLYLQYGV